MVISPFFNRSCCIISSDYRYLPNKKPMGDMRPADDISPPYRGYVPEYTDQDYYGDYEFQSSHASSEPRASDYQQPRKKHKVQPLLEPTAPNVFQVCIKFYN